METAPSRLFPEKRLWQDHPSPVSVSFLLIRLKLWLPSYSRTFPFSVESITIHLSPASLSDSLIAHDKPAYASTYRGLRGRTSPSWELQEARCNQRLPHLRQQQNRFSLVAFTWMAACNLSHTLKIFPKQGDDKDSCVCGPPAETEAPAQFLDSFPHI